MSARSIGPTSAARSFGIALTLVVALASPSPAVASQPARIAAAVPTCFGLTPTIVGTDGEDVIVGTAGDDVIVGLDGNDTIDGLGGDDTICSGPNPFIRDPDAQTNYDHVERVEGGEGNDRIDGGDGLDILNGGAGDDLLEGGDNPLLPGGDDDYVGELLYGDDGDDHLDGGPGFDILWGLAGDDLLTGGPESDQMMGNDGDDVLDGGEGNDFMVGGPGSDTGDGGPGNDGLYDMTEPGDVGSNTFIGGDGDDRLDGGPGDDVLVGGDGADRLDGLAGDDDMYGQRGADTLLAGPGDDLMWGGLGVDIADYSTRHAGVHIDLREGTAIGRHGSLDSLRGIRDVWGGSGPDVLLGNRQRNTFIVGNSEGGIELPSSDVVKGRGGSDTLAISYQYGDYVVDLGRGFVRPADGRDRTRLVSVENARVILTRDSSGRRYRNIEPDGTMIGSDGPNLLHGGAGREVISGLGGDDVIVGSGGRDHLDGGPGRDQIRGGRGDDVCISPSRKPGAVGC